MPDALTRFGIRRLVASGLNARSRLSPEQSHEEFRAMIRNLRESPIAVETDTANEQHYELPPEFFGLCLGPHRKYSGCYWPPGVNSLAAAETAALQLVCERAQLADGQTILELGCGWGSLSLWMAEHYPSASILAVSNSVPQREFIVSERDRRGLKNLQIETADMNSFATERRFDRIVSVEMFEHMRNYEVLMRRIASWLNPCGRLFVHIFAHRRTAYLFTTNGPADWMGRYFFTGGIMPSEDLLLHFQQDLMLEDCWRQCGTHYQRTAEAWLANLDANRNAALQILERGYGPGQGELWLNRWRVFFMSCAELFGFSGGGEWGVAHYRFAKRPS